MHPPFRLHPRLVPSRGCHLTLGLFLVTMGMVPQAGQAGAAAIDRPEAVARQASSASLFDRVWDGANLVSAPDAGVLQEFKLQGRLQLQFAYGTSEDGSFDSGDRPDEFTWGDVEVRRWMVGFKSRWFHTLHLDTEINLRANDGPVYKDIFDLRLVWDASERFSIGLGKRRANLFTIEQSTSSKTLPTMERTIIAGNLFPGELTGVWGHWEGGEWSVESGFFGGDYNPEVATFSASEALLNQTSIAWDLHEKTGLNVTRLRLDYQGTTKTGSAAVGQRFSNAVAVGAELGGGAWSCLAEVMGGWGRGDVGDLFGFYVTPSWMVTPKWQLVGRYAYGHGEHDDLLLRLRYDRLAPGLTQGGRTEEAHQVYVGVNYLIYGHKLKLMSGVEYLHASAGAAGDNLDCWTGLAGLRLYF